MLHPWRANSSIAGAAVLAAILVVMPATGAIVSTGPFVGNHSETFNEFNTVMAVQTLSVFDGTATLNNFTSGGAIKVEFSSSLNGVQELPRSGMMAGQLGIGSWQFDQPVLAFGGYWANNSGADDATVSFYDAGGSLLGTTTAHVPFAAHTWTWNGWQSDVPISRIDVVGNGLINGFIWYDDMQVTYAPEPGGAALLLLALLLRLARR